RLLALEAELEAAQTAHEQLEAQKHENMLLKETIDRMRWEMDEMRNAMGGGVTGGSAGGGGRESGRRSKSLGGELVGKMGVWGGAEAEGEKGGEGEDVAEEGDVEAERGEEEEEDEDVIQTIITRKKRVCVPFLSLFLV